MIVYRVEHATAVDDRTHHNVGPMGDVDRFYDRGKKNGWDLACEAQRAACRAFNGHKDKPTPFWDYYLQGIKEDEICGANSMESLRFWFEDSIPALEAAGFVINKYSVPDRYCRLGQSGQVLFKYKHAQLVDNEERY